MHSAHDWRSLGFDTAFSHPAGGREARVTYDILLPGTDVVWGTVSQRRRSGSIGADYEVAVRATGGPACTDSNLLYNLALCIASTMISLGRPDQSQLRLLTEELCAADSTLCASGAAVHDPTTEFFQIDLPVGFAVGAIARAAVGAIAARFTSANTAATTSTRATQASTTAASKAPRGILATDDLALGLDDTGRRRGFARSNGVNYDDVIEDRYPGMPFSTLTTAIDDTVAAGGRIHSDLDGIEGVEDILQASSDAGLGDTAPGLRYVCNTPAVLAATTFHRGSAPC